VPPYIAKVLLKIRRMAGVGTVTFTIALGNYTFDIKEFYYVR
jgi:hypothetical protein